VTQRSKEQGHDESHWQEARCSVSRPSAIGSTRARDPAFGTIAKLPIALAESVCKASVENLNQLVADTMTLRDMYKKHHWQVAGPTFYQLHLLYDKHFDEQSELVDSLAERIQSLGGVSIAMAHDVAETTLIPRLPRGPAASSGAAGAAAACTRDRAARSSFNGQASR